MKQLSLITVLLLLPLLGLAQVEITIYGNNTDSTVIKQKARLEAKGFEVTVLPEREDDSEDISDPFIKKWTNERLPDISLTTISGDTIETSELKGKNIHINFWSVTCKPCIEEFSELNEIKKKYPNWEFIAIAPEGESKIQKITNRNPFDYKLVANSKQLFEDLGIDGYPKNFFVNAEGIITKVTDGANYKLAEKNGKMTMVPDNFKVYNEIMEKF